MADHAGMADHMAPDYELEPTLPLETVDQYRAIFEETRQQIVDLLLERAATIKELSVTLGKPKGTIGHHVSVLEDAGLIRVVRTKMVRAIEAKYYGRMARTYLIGDKAVPGVELRPDHFLTEAAAEFAEYNRDAPVDPLSSLRHLRIPDDRAQEWFDRLVGLLEDFVEEPRGGKHTYGLLIAFYPTTKPHLPDHRDDE